MSRPKKKPNYNPDQVMQEFMAAVADAFGSYDDREDKTFPGLNAVAAEFGITALKARKLLITAGVYSTALSRQVPGICAGGRELFARAPTHHGVDRQKRGRKRHDIKVHPQHGLPGEREGGDVSKGFFAERKSVQAASWRCVWRD